MSWNASNVMDQRVSFISAVVVGEMSMTELCALYSISPVTGYKWLRRYQAEGSAGLHDRSSAPHLHGRQTPEAIAEASRSRRAAAQAAARTGDGAAADAPALSQPCLVSRPTPGFDPVAHHAAMDEFNGEQANEAAIKRLAEFENGRRSKKIKSTLTKFRGPVLDRHN